MNQRNPFVLFIGVLLAFSVFFVGAEAQSTSVQQNVCRVWKKPESFVGRAITLQVRHRLIWGQLFVFDDRCPKRMIAIEYPNEQKRNAVIQETGQYLENQAPGRIEGRSTEVLVELNRRHRLRQPEGGLRNFSFTFVSIGNVKGLGRHGAAIPPSEKRPVNLCAVAREPERFIGITIGLEARLLKLPGRPFEEGRIALPDCGSEPLRFITISFSDGEAARELKASLEKSMFCVDGVDTCAGHISAIAKLRRTESSEFPYAFEVDRLPHNSEYLRFPK